MKSIDSFHGLGVPDHQDATEAFNNQLCLGDSQRFCHQWYLKNKYSMIGVLFYWIPALGILKLWIGLDL